MKVSRAYLTKGPDQMLFKQAHNYNYQNCNDEDNFDHNTSLNLTIMPIKIFHITKTPKLASIISYRRSTTPTDFVMTFPGIRQNSRQIASSLQTKKDACTIDIYENKRFVKRKWRGNDDVKLMKLIEKYGEDFNSIAKHLPKHNLTDIILRYYKRIKHLKIRDFTRRNGENLRQILLKELTPYEIQMLRSYDNSNLSYDYNSFTVNPRNDIASLTIRERVNDENHNLYDSIISPSFKDYLSDNRTESENNLSFEIDLEKSFVLEPKKSKFSYNSEATETIYPFLMSSSITVKAACDSILQNKEGLYFHECLDFTHTMRDEEFIKYKEQLISGLKFESGSQSIETEQLNNSILTIENQRLETIIFSYSALFESLDLNYSGKLQTQIRDEIFALKSEQITLIEDLNEFKLLNSEQHHSSSGVLKKEIDILISLVKKKRSILELLIRLSRCKS